MSAKVSEQVPGNAATVSDLQSAQQASAAGIRVFVYGTLKKGHSNHRILSDGKAELLGRCHIDGNFNLVDVQSYYPGLIRVAGEPTLRNRVFGEVYRITSDVLDSLDLLEGHPQYYCREHVITPWKKAWSYFLPEKYASRFKKIQTGVWRPFKEELDFIAAITNGATNGASPDEIAATLKKLDPPTGK